MKLRLPPHRRALPWWKRLLCLIGLHGPTDQRIACPHCIEHRCHWCGKTWDEWSA